MLRQNRPRILRSGEFRGRNLRKRGVEYVARGGVLDVAQQGISLGTLLKPGAEKVARGMRRMMRTMLMRMAHNARHDA
jgi:hypothetical protein